MIPLDRVLGGAVLAFGASLLLILIPVYTTPQPGSPTDPSLFPRIAGWMFVLLGGLQIVFPGQQRLTVTLLEGGQGVHVLRRVVVAADDGPDDLGVIPQHLFQQASRPHGPILGLRLGAGLVLAPDAAKELVQIMDYPHEMDLPGLVSESID